MKIKSLYKNFGELQLFKDFNFELKKGEITCILGQSGCGKTTLLNMIAGLESYQGEIERVKVSYVFQEPRLIPNLTVKENLKMVCADEQKINSILADTEILDKINDYPKTLSGGQAQRVSLCRAFLSEGELLLMDEPFSSLDLKLKIKLMRTFFDMQKKNHITTLFVTHDVEEALCLADRIVVISRGKIVYDDYLKGTIMREYGEPNPDRQKILNVILNS